MNLKGFHLTHHKVFDIFKRVIRIFSRYGFFSYKMIKKIKTFQNILNDFDAPATFFITARTLAKYAKVIKKSTDQNVEFGIHGLEHLDYTKLSKDEVHSHLKEAVDIFKNNQIKSIGFRFPYLSYNRQLLDIFPKLFLDYNCSATIYWGDIIYNSDKNFAKIQSIKKYLDMYDWKSATSCISIPNLYKETIEIPVSLPDDDLLERAHLINSKSVNKIWGEILRLTHVRGELFVLQLHQERIFMFEDALKFILKKSKYEYSHIWIASIKQIAEWWKEKQKFSAKIVNENNGNYEIKINCTPRGTFLIKSKDAPNNMFFQDFCIFKGKKISLRSEKRPLIGVAGDTSPELKKFLKNEGYLFEISSKKEIYSVYFDNKNQFKENNSWEILEKISRAQSPLIRFWRWPNAHRSALAITGDIDAITISDFFSRLNYRKQ